MEREKQNEPIKVPRPWTKYGEARALAAACLDQSRTWDISRRETAKIAVGILNDMGFTNLTGAPVEAQSFIAFFNSKGWKGATIDDTVASLRARVPEETVHGADETVRVALKNIRLAKKNESLEEEREEGRRWTTQPDSKPLLAALLERVAREKGFGDTQDRSFSIVESRPIAVAFTKMGYVAGGGGTLSPNAVFAYLRPLLKKHNNDVAAIINQLREGVSADEVTNANTKADELLEEIVLDQPVQLRARILQLQAEIEKLTGQLRDSEDRHLLRDGSFNYLETELSSVAYDFGRAREEAQTWKEEYQKKKLAELTRRLKAVGDKIGWRAARGDPNETDSQ